MILNKEIVKIIQITDTHLFKKNSSIFDIDTNAAFKTIINNIQDDLRDADAIFLTGDLSQDESLESYEMVIHAFENFEKKLFWIPGNHDSVINMHKVFDNKKNFIRGKRVLTDVWDFIFLNTKQEGKESGFLSDNELQFLRFELNKETSKPIALVMHHHPIEVKTPLIDNFILENRDQLLEVIDKNTIHLMICGHVHHDYSLHYGNIPLETSPATCFQFQKGSRELRIENSIGYKIYYFSSTNYVTKTKFFKN